MQKNRNAEEQKCRRTEMQNYRSAKCRITEVQNAELQKSREIEILEILGAQGETWKKKLLQS